MKRASLLLFILLTSLYSNAQRIEVIKKEHLLKIFNPDSGFYVVNFWATWCKPCLEEMPFFQTADSMYSRKVNFIFVSFDFSDDSTRVSKTVIRRKIPGKHYLIDETDMDVLINAVDSNWSGSLPATWFIEPGYKFAELQNFSHFDDIKSKIEALIASEYEIE